MRVLVTGGAGFIGSSLTRLLLASEHTAIVFDKLTYAGNLSSLDEVRSHPNFTFIEGDVCDAVAVRNAFERTKPDAIMHLAAESHVDRSITGAKEFIDTNIIGTFVLLEAARHYLTDLPLEARERFRFLHVSTDEVFGSLGAEGYFREDTPFDPRSPYSASKAASDHLVSAWGHTYGLPVLISNCSNNYGPRQTPEKLIPLMVLNALHGEPLPLYGDGLNIRDWLYVDDHARALMLILEKGRIGQTYNVGSRNERTNREIVETICALLDDLAPQRAPHSNLIKRVADRPGHDKRYAIDPNKIESELGWRPLESFETGIASTIRWYLDNTQWWEPLRRAGHGATRLGLPAGR